MPRPAPPTPAAIGVSVIAHVVLIAWVAAVLSDGRIPTGSPKPLSPQDSAKAPAIKLVATPSAIVIHTLLREQRL